MIDHDHRQRAARRQARFPVQRQIFKLPLQSGIQRRHHFVSALPSIIREKSGASCGICRGNSHTALHATLYRCADQTP
jgi:hypothetical protein